jgi:serine/threonine protein kinase
MLSGGIDMHFHHSDAIHFYLLSLVTPFNPNQNENEIPTRVLAGRINWPRTIDEGTKAFIKKLLIQNPDKRLGAGRNGSREVKEQPIFSSTKWDDVYARKTKPPIVPTVKHPGDTSCFDQYQEDWRSAPFASDKELDLFKDF